MKYFNERTSGFASRAEFQCFQLLKLRERAGEIKDIQCQVTSPLTAGITHKTDFKFFDIQRNAYVWAEYKGFEDARWRMIRKLWKEHGPGVLEIYKGAGLRISCTETITPKG